MTGSPVCPMRHGQCSQARAHGDAIFNQNCFCLLTEFAGQEMPVVSASISLDEKCTKVH